MEQLHSYVWRRHVAAVAGRALAASPDELETNTLVVGFADVVGYTRLTRNLPDAELAELIERFESTVADVIAAGTGRVIKMLGDEALFAASDPAAAAAIALDLLDASSSTGSCPTSASGWPGATSSAASAMSTARWSTWPAG